MATPKTLILTKAGYRQAGFSRGLLRIFLAIDAVLREPLPGWPAQIVVTSGSDGSHAATGAHKAPRFEAIDTRTKTGFASSETKRSFMQAVLVALEDGPILSSFVNRAGHFQMTTRRFVVLLEHEGHAHEHHHWQVRRGHTIRD